MTQDELVGRVADLLIEHGCGTGVQCEATARAIIPIVQAEQRERDVRYEAAWRDLFEPLAWMQGHPDLPVKYLGQNLAWVASDLIAEAYPEFAIAIRKGAE